MLKSIEVVYGSETGKWADFMLKLTHFTVSLCSLSNENPDIQTILKFYFLIFYKFKDIQVVSAQRVNAELL